MVRPVESTATDYLVPSPEFVALALVVLVVGLVWPLVDSLRRGRFVWSLIILLTPPLGGVAWLVLVRLLEDRLLLRVARPLRN